MNTQTQRVLEEALGLSEEDRADLAASLIESLDATVDPSVEEAWRVEVERRLHELDSGRAQTVPWTEVRAELLARARKSRAR